MIAFIAVFFLGLFVLYYCWTVRAWRIDAVAAPGAKSFVRFVESNQNMLSTLRKVYYPFPLLLSSHVQTVFATVWRRALSKIYYKRHTFVCNDGEVSIVDEAIGDKTSKLTDDSPVILFLHGLSGGSESIYMRSAIAKIQASSVVEARLLVMHARGTARTRDDDDSAAAAVLTKGRFFHAGFIDDVVDVANELQRRFPRALKIIVGFSLGANVMTCYLGRHATHPFDGAMSICNPFDLSRTHERMVVMPGLLYSRVLNEGLKALLRRHAAAVKCELLAGLDSKCVYDFDKVRA
jgi:predicted alpha/beta-fold hydrolase